MKQFLRVALATFLIGYVGLVSAAPRVTTGQQGVKFNAEVGLEACRGSIPGVSCEFKFGDNEEVGTTAETVWGSNIGVDNFFPAAASVMQVTSTDVDDTSAGAGARTIEITYLDANYDEGTETVTLNGQTEVTTTAEILRINRIKVLTAGATGWNEGYIYVFQGTGSTAGVPTDVTTIVNAITIDHNQTTSAFYTVPNGKVGMFCGMFNTVAGNKTASLQFRVKDNGVFRTQMDFDLINQGLYHPILVPFKYAEQTDVRWTAAVDTGTGRVSAMFTIILYDENLF